MKCKECNERDAVIIKDGRKICAECEITELQKIARADLPRDFASANGRPPGFTFDLNHDTLRVRR